MTRLTKTQAGIQVGIGSRPRFLRGFELPTRMAGSVASGHGLVACGIRASADRHPGCEATRIRAGYKPAPTGRLVREPGW